MNVATIEMKQLSLRKLNIKQDLFCKVYATDVRCLGNGTEAYKMIYGDHISHDVAKASASRFLADDRFTMRIDEYIDASGFNNQTVDAHHLFLIRQKKDLNVSGKMIAEYNKLKNRIKTTIEITTPKPIMSLDDDEVIHKIDKSKAKGGLT